ncbi:poly-beta-hydroxybutyrate polymerase N-terminal domain-containing protein [Sphingobium sp. H39-3-25]|uniref:poly-beta-hydroxybutyrate polymerase N-terminal domain-containing protein n=1 Tax=Sphingobium arseniciresistens TaxID=3030834 RepID=UPI0023B9DC76|nr:poly-beta-hydroxybutyrate polymerase N-terminal domain-containing protein [Sphingobium arseniciresistens]
MAAVDLTHVPDPLDGIAETLDHAASAQLTAGLSSAAADDALADWSLHIALSPGNSP